MRIGRGGSEAREARNLASRGLSSEEGEGEKAEDEEAEEEEEGGGDEEAKEDEEEEVLLACAESTRAASGAQLDRARVQCEK